MSSYSSPSFDSHGPSHLGLWNTVHLSYVPERQPRSLSVRTAGGQCVSILNDDTPTYTSSDSGSEDGRQYAHSDGDFRLSNPLPSPQLTPTRLPSLSALVEAVSISGSDMMLPPPCTHSYASSHSLHLHRAPAYSQVVPRTQTKRKYPCTYPGCGKAFTTSGHLSRHFRIHTGEKNYHCPFAGCSSRFSRQDNMMQHYRTHLSPRSRRNRTARAATTTGYPGALAGYSTDSNFSPYKRAAAQFSPAAPSNWTFF